MKQMALIAAVLALAALPAAAQPDAAGTPDTQAAAAAIDTLLDGTFRIDIETIAATLDWYPASGLVDGTARLDFRHAPGPEPGSLQLHAVRDVALGDPPP